MDVPLSPIRSQKAYRTIVRTIVGLIARGELEYGNRLYNEQELMAMLGVSRPTLREALRVLEFLGIATVAPRRGILINQPQDSEGYLPLLSVLLFERITDRELFELRIQASEHFEVALSIDNAALADVYCLRLPVDLILMDVVTRGGESGLDAAARIKRAFPQIKIIIVTSMPECSYLSRAREIGVESFWYKEEQRESLLDVMERTMAGESVYPDATPELQLGLASSYKFTDRELEVLREMTGGDTNQEIAERLHMSVATVKTHILNMLEKTGFRNRTELAVRARESGLVILNRKN